MITAGVGAHIVELANDLGDRCDDIAPHIDIARNANVGFKRTFDGTGFGPRQAG